MLHDAIVLTIAQDETKKTAEQVRDWAVARAQEAGRAKRKSKTIGASVKKAFLNVSDKLFSRGEDSSMLMVALEFNDDDVKCDFVADGVRRRHSLGDDAELCDAMDAAKRRKRTPDGCTRLRMTMA